MQMKKKSIILILSIVILTVLVAVLFATNLKYNKYFDYHRDETFVNNLTIRTRLLGQYKYEDKTVLYTGPYKLRISFRESNATPIVDLSEIRFINQEIGVSFSLSPNTAIVERENGVIYFVFKDVELEYYDYDLLLEYKLEDDKKPSTITLSLKKNYKEFISFRFWDRLMSV
jgi:hypothetical protein